MTTSAIIMLCVGICVTWGGAAFCIRLAIKNNRH